MAGCIERLELNFNFPSYRIRDGMFQRLVMGLVCDICAMGSHTVQQFRLALV